MGLSWRRVDSRAGLPGEHRRHPWRRPCLLLRPATPDGLPALHGPQDPRHPAPVRNGTTGAHVNTIEADGIILAEAIFPNQLSWSAYKPPERRWRNASEPLGDEYSLDFEKTAATKRAISGGMTLTVKPTWRGDREVQQLRIPSGLSLALSSALPEPTAKYVETLEWLQDLIGLGRQ